MLLHGWGLNLRIFDSLRDELVRDFGVIAVDLPGHGASDWDAGAGGDLQLTELLRTVPDGACLLGWSLGGQFALRAALRAPHRLRG